MSLQQLRTEAYTTFDVEFLRKNISNPDMGIRKNIARNPRTPMDLLEILAKDPTANVSYIANKRLETSRYYDRFVESHPCVQCESITNNECNSCNKHQNVYKIEKLPKAKWYEKFTI